MKATALVLLAMLLGWASWVYAAELKYSQVSCKINRAQLTVNVEKKRALLDGKKLANISNIKANNSTLTVTLDNPNAQDIHTVQVKMPRLIQSGVIENLVVIQTDYTGYARMSSYECVVTK